MHSSQTEFVIFDVETTGFYPVKGDRIIEIAAIKVKNKKIISSFESLINPQRDLPEQSKAVHNITEEMLKDAPKAEDILPGMIDFIGNACLVGHNIKFDLDFLCYQLSAIGRKLRPETPALDTLKMSKHLVPQLSNHKLSSLALFFGVPIDETHRALPDVHLTIKVFYHLIEKARQQKIESFQELIQKYSVQKPQFKMDQETNQELLF